MRSKQDIRKQLEAGMAAFLSNGGKITKCNTFKPVGGRRTGQPKDKVVEVEIDVEMLPPTLRKYMEE